MVYFKRADQTRTIAIRFPDNTILAFPNFNSGYRMQRSAYSGLLICVMFCAAAPCFGDKLTLNDGTVLEGTIIPRADDYWVKTPDGETHTIPKSAVKSLEKTAVRSPGATGSTGTPVAGPTAAVSAEFSITKRKADVVLLPDVAVDLWKAFISTHTAAPDLSAAEKELDKWQKLADDGSERITGKWVSGDDKKAMVAKSAVLLKAAAEDMSKSQTVNAVEKLKEANKVYPNSMDVNFTLGYIALTAHNHEEAVPYFEQCLKLNPKSGSAANNLAICLWETKKIDRALATFLRCRHRRR